MKRLPTTLALLALVSALAVAGGEPEHCPEQCQCSAIDAVDMSCELPAANLTVKGQPGSSISITCDDEHGNDVFSCQDIPEMEYGQQQRIRLELRGCRLPGRAGDLACAGGRLGASGVEQLYLFAMRPGMEVTEGLVRGMGALDRLAVYGDSSDTPNMTIPVEALSVLPDLTFLTLNGVHLSLRPGDFAPAPHLTQLELTSCSIRHLPPGIFRPLKNLEKLFLWQNQIEDIEGQFDGLTSLRRVDLSNNQLRSLTSLGAASPPPPLTHLFARFNKIAVLTPLTNLTNLEQLELFFNSVPLSVSPSALSSLPHLTTVLLSGNNIASLPSDLFRNSSALKTLNLAKNRLQELPEDLFRDQSALQDLDLSGNRLETLAKGTFASLRALRILNLDGNLLAAFIPGLFSSLASLRELHAASNRLSRLAAGDFAPLRRLEQLYLQHNRITTPNQTDLMQYENFDATFNQLTQLQTLDLSHNRLSAAVANFNQVAISLLRLDMSYNNITYLYNTDLEPISEEAVIDLSHNEIAQVIYLDGLAPPDPAHAAPAAPRPAVLLGDNPYRCDCYLFYFLQRLHGYRPLVSVVAELDVSEARCAAPAGLRGVALRDVPLRDVTCSFNETECPGRCSCLLRSYTATLELTCEEVPEKFPDAMTSGARAMSLALTAAPPVLSLPDTIGSLNLSGLSMRELPMGLMESLPSHVDLTGNDFSHVPPELLERNVTLRLARNPLACDCWHAADVGALQRNLAKIEDKESVTCSNGETISSVSVNQLCSANRAAALGGALAALGVVVAIGALLALRYRTHIRVWLYSHGMCARWLAIDDEERKYDAFVSFCHEDTEFVQEKLLPRLEADYKLCVHYRDWTPGEWIPAQIATSVAESRRTVVVVSRKFLDSRWARAEFRTANISAIKERTTRVIVVLLEDVSSHKELDPELKAYLATNTYLKWGDQWFWDKMRYAMPHKRPDATKTVSKASDQSKLATIPGKAKWSEGKEKRQALDARLTADGVIINAAALVAPKHKRAEHIQLDIAAISKGKQFG